MAKVTIKCPVCGETLENGLCPKCGYLRLIFPEAIPQFLKEVEQRRISAAQTMLNKFSEIERKNKTSLKESTEEINGLKSKISDLEKEISYSKKDNYRLGNDCSTLQSEKLQLSNRISSLEQDIAKAERKVSDQQLAHYTEVTKIREQLQSSQSEVQELKRGQSQQLKGIVMIEDKRNDTRTMLPVYEGNNSYGTNPDNGLHHQIKFQVRGFSFHPVQFYIRTSAKGLILESASGVEMTQNGGVVRSGVYARQSDNFMFGDRIRINISQI